MAQSKMNKKAMNMVYGLGAAVVIVGALFKIQHWPGGSLMLTIGLLVEAGVFIVSAFESVEEELDWTKVYPELVGSVGFNDQIDTPADAQGLLSKKLDSLLKEAKLDAGLVASLGASIKDFQGAAEGLSSSAASVDSTNKYNEQMALATVKMESLNSLYQIQMEHANQQAELNGALVANTQKLQDQMESLATNMSSLNGVYGGMLSAMTTK